jgi:CheY-like chemotaxis protein
LHLQPLSLHDVIESAAATVKPAAQAKEIRLYLALNALMQPIQGDPARLQQVVWNLLINAIKFTPRGGRIEVQLEETDGWQEIVVTDNGEGINPEFLPFVFERFRQADSSSRRQHGGLGLGLALVRHIAEMHGGHVDVFSAGVGHGATFKVSLPLHKSTATSSAPDAAPNLDHNVQANAVGSLRDGTRQAALQGQRILVVDDDAEARSLVRTILETAGAEVTPVDSAAEALRILTQSGTDLLISDIGMPQQDGYSLMRRVRAIPTAACNIPAIALTAYAAPQDRQRALNAGFNYFMPKPVEPDALLKLVSSIVT